MTERCSTCKGILVWITLDAQHVLACPRPMCPGHNAASLPFTLPVAVTEPPAAHRAAPGSEGRRAVRATSVARRHDHPRTLTAAGAAENAPPEADHDNRTSGEQHHA